MVKWLSPFTRKVATTAQGVVSYMCRHYTVFSRLQNCVNRARRNIGRRMSEGRTKDRKRRERTMNRLEAGRYVCCVWEKRLKPFDVKVVRIASVRDSGIAGGLADVELENGIWFRGSNAKSRHLFQDKARLTNALEAPTRANVLIFSEGIDARRYLESKGYGSLYEGVDFSPMEGDEEEDAEKKGK